MLTEDLEKYLRNLLNAGVRLEMVIPSNAHDDQWNYEFYDGDNKFFQMSLLQYDGLDDEDRNDFIAFGKYNPKILKVGSDGYVYYLGFDETDYEFAPSTRSSIMIDRNLDPPFYNVLFTLKDELRANPWLANYFDLTKRR